MIRAANRANCWSARVRWRNTRTAIATAAKPALQSCEGHTNAARRVVCQVDLPSLCPRSEKERRGGSTHDELEIVVVL